MTLKHRDTVVSVKLAGTLLLVLSSILVSCGSPSMPPKPAVAPVSSPDDEALDRVIAIHGGAGPWVVAGYRMGLYAEHELGLARGSFDLVVTHFAPQKVQYSCIADGAAAATGASMGRLNLVFADASAADTHTTYTNKATGKSVTLRLAKTFADRYTDVPRPKLGAAGREVLHLRDDEIFVVDGAPPPPP